MYVIINASVVVMSYSVLINRFFKLFKQCFLSQANEFVIMSNSKLHNKFYYKFPTTQNCITVHSAPFTWAQLVGNRPIDGMHQKMAPCDSIQGFAVFAVTCCE